MDLHLGQPGTDHTGDIVKNALGDFTGAADAFDLGRGFQRAHERGDAIG